MYVYGVLFTISVADGIAHKVLNIDDPGVVYWASLPASMFTLFKAISNGVGWHDVLVPLSRVGWGLEALFSSYIVFAYFAVLNVVTGTFCSSAIEAAQRDPD